MIALTMYTVKLLQLREWAARQQLKLNAGSLKSKIGHARACVFKNLVSHLGETAKRSPDQIALYSDSDSNFKERNFKELYQDVGKCAIFCSKKGLVQGQKALLFVKPGYELTVLAFSLIYLGVIPVIIDPGMGFRSVLSCIRSTKPDALIGVPLVVWMSFYIQKIHSRQSTRRFELAKSFLHQHIFSAPSRSDYCPQASTKAEELAAIVFTSGSTGTPKGVKYLHKNFNSQVDLPPGLISILLREKLILLHSLSFPFLIQRWE